MDWTPHLKETYKRHTCVKCEKSLEEAAFRIMREEKDYLVVSVKCGLCEAPQGVGLIGIEREEACPEKKSGKTSSP